MKPALRQMKLDLQPAKLRDFRKGLMKNEGSVLISQVEIIISIFNGSLDFE